MESFSKKLKNQLIAEEIKKKCCRNMYRKIEEFEFTSDFSLREIYDHAKCEQCRNVVIRVLFIRFGSMTDPEKSYHLDFSFANEEFADEVLDILSESGFDFKKTTRKSRHVLYLKESTAIEDFLVFIGASQAAFNLMNSKIMREFRNSVNRQVNCDTANIEKQLAAVKKYTEAINYLVETGKIDSLSEDLRETALLRLKNEQLSLADLGKLFSPPVSKSGVKHRLDKILAAAQNELEK